MPPRGSGIGILTVLRTPLYPPVHRGKFSLPVDEEGRGGVFRCESLFTKRNTWLPSHNPDPNKPLSAHFPALSIVARSGLIC